MARLSERLSAKRVELATKPGMYPDGHGLYLRVGPTGTKSWVYRYRNDGRRHDLGLGPYHLVSLAEARKNAIEQRRLRHLDGKDPLLIRRLDRDQAKLAAAKATTFKECAEAYITAHQAGWRNPKHRAQWSSTLETYVYGRFGDLPVRAIDVGLVMKAMEPIWTVKPETASRVRGRIEAVLDWAAARGYREGENPARWRGHLENLLPRPGKVKRVQHHAALPYYEIGAFMAKLRTQEGTAARALEFLVLTAGRTGEVIGTRWSEIDLAQKLWTVPGERMKAGREHRVPLSARAREIVEQMKSAACGTPDAAGVVFPGLKSSSLSNMALLMSLRRMGYAGLTAHGFRSTFRDWAAERTGFPAEVAEMALAHSVGDKVEAAYRRGDLFAKRRQIMEAWARFCSAA